MQQRSRLFFCQKLVNMAGMLFAAASPSALAFLLRFKDATSVTVPCSYLYHPASNSTSVLHGTLPEQLLYVDSTLTDRGVLLNKTAEFCISSGGEFCFEALYANGTHFWYEQTLKVIEETCMDAPEATPLKLDRYEMSSLASLQLAFIITAAAFGLYHTGAMQWLIHRVQERAAEEAHGVAKLPLVSSVMRSLNNAAFRPLLLAWALDGLALAALVTMFPFYIR